MKTSNVIRLFGEILRIDPATRTIRGYAYATADCGDGYVLPRDVMERLAPEYMEWANIREMHGKTAVGVAESLEWDDTGALLTVRVVDDQAWEKVEAGVYKGFSIGVKPTKVLRGKKITVQDGEWFETSLVDRPWDKKGKFEILHSMGEPEEWECEETAETDANAETVDRAASEQPAADPEPDATEFRAMFRGFMMAKLKGNETKTLIREALSCLDSFCWSLRYGDYTAPEGMTMRSAFEIAMNDTRDYVAPLIDALPVTRSEGEGDTALIEDALRAFGDGSFDPQTISRMEAAEASVITLTAERDDLARRVTEFEALPDPSQQKPIARAISDETIEEMHAALVERREKAKDSAPGLIKLKAEYDSAAEKDAAFLELNRAK